MVELEPIIIIKFFVSSYEELKEGFPLLSLRPLCNFVCFIYHTSLVFVLPRAKTVSSATGILFDYPPFTHLKKTNVFTFADPHQSR